VFEGKHEIIFKDDYCSSLLFTKVAIDDVTIIIKQDLLKAIPKNQEERIGKAEGFNLRPPHHRPYGFA